MFLKTWRERRHAAKMCDQAIAYLKPHASGSDPALVGPSPVVRALDHGLVETYVFDAGTHFELVQSRHLELAGVELEAFRAQAIDNLLGFTLGNGRLEIVRTGRAFAVVQGGGIEASLYLADAFWDWLADQGHVPGAVTIAIPARDVLGFCDASDAAAKQELRGVVQRLWAPGAATPNTLLSDRLFTRVDGAWVPD